MKNNTLVELLVAFVLLVLVLLLLDPFSFWMPPAMLMAMLGVAVAVFGVFAGFVIRERAVDERDALHRMHAGRVAFLVGAGVLLLGIAVESLSHTIDPWLVAGFAAMVIAKIVTRLYNDRNA